ncbi:cleft lip and palate transmembrane protein-like protein [Trifolium medium]|uniref:Cleft lip and palate transmembrane protein-like protein n=1 Tax=Trifolium medium TaxID=97028 RepID=A0A392Q3M2_9FABA|nr:cleft lip and palate transmembrane protein-like protein [Trifolium medium]
MFRIEFVKPETVRWIYPVDKKRVNEFGFGGEDDQPQAVDSAETVAAKEEEKKTN